MIEQDIQKEFEQAITTLKQVNDELFFTELKQKFDEHLLKYNCSYDENVKIIKGMEVVIKRIPTQLNADWVKFSEKILNESIEKLEKTSNAISKVYDEQICQCAQALNNIGSNYSELYNAFHTDFSVFMESHNDMIKSQSQWLKEAKDILEEHKKQLSEDLKNQFENRLESFTKQLDSNRDSLGAHFDKIITSQMELREAILADGKRNNESLEILTKELSSQVKKDFKELRTNLEGKIEVLEKYLSDVLEKHRESTNKKSKIVQGIGLAILILQVVMIVCLFIK